MILAWIVISITTLICHIPEQVAPTAISSTTIKWMKTKVNTRVTLLSVGVFAPVFVVSTGGGGGSDTGEGKKELV